MVSFTGAGSPATAGASGTTTGTATAVATTPAATPSPAMAKTYEERYSYMPDILHQSYASLYDKADLLSSSTPAELLNHAIATRNVVPKAYVCLLENQSKEPLMTVLHRPFQFQPHPTRASRWDGRIFCFEGDVMRGNNIITRELPAEMFETTGSHKVPKLADIDPLLAALPEDNHFLPLPARNAATDEIQARYMVQLPHSYVPLAMNLAAQKASPAKWWSDLGGAIKNDNKTTELELLHNFLRLSCVRQSNDPTLDRDPGTMTGTKEENFPPLDIDADLNECIIETLHEDLPALTAPPATTTDNSTGLAIVMREEYALNRAQRDREKRDQDAKEAARKKPSFVFPNNHTRWMRNCQAATEDSLEPFYHRWAIIKSSERRPELQGAVDNRALVDTSAGKRAPIITKELFDMTHKGNLGSRDIDILTEGVSPFTCGFIVGSRPEIAARISDYDIAMQGRSAPTVGEQQRFSTKEVPLPTTTYHAGAMLKSTSLFLDVVQGSTNPHAVAFRRFCVDDWPDIEDDLQKTGEPDTVGNVLPSICRTVQIKMVTYLQELSDGRAPSLPNYHEIRLFVRRHEWYKLQPIPQRYAIIREAPSVHQENPNAAQTGGSGTVESARSQKRKALGDRSNNGSAVPEWKKALEESGLLPNQIMKKAPTTIDESKTPAVAVELCMSWHLRGWCFTGCERISTHRNLSTSERKEMDEFVKKHIKKDE